jgi:hypothetical protein
MPTTFIAMNDPYGHMEARFLHVQKDQDDLGTERIEVKILGYPE